MTSQDTDYWPIYILQANIVFRKQILFVGSISFASVINICFAPLDCAFKILPRCTNQPQEWFQPFFFFSKFGHNAFSQLSEIECAIPPLPAGLQSWFASFTIRSTRRHCRQREKVCGASRGNEKALQCSWVLLWVGGARRRKPRLILRSGIGKVVNSPAYVLWKTGLQTLCSLNSAQTHFLWLTYCTGRFSVCLALSHEWGFARLTWDPIGVLVSISDLLTCLSETSFNLWKIFPEQKFCRLEKNAEALTLLSAFRVGILK